MIEEVKALMDNGITPDRLNLFGMEYREIGNYLLQKCSYSEMATSLAKEIHHLAKRQMTCFRGMERRGLTVHWIKEAHEIEAKEIAAAFLAD